MHAFAYLLNQLYFTYSNLAKIEILKNYFANTPDPDRGMALGIIAGTIKFADFKRSIIRELLSERVDTVLFDLSYDYVGDFSETAALLWPNKVDQIKKPLPSLATLIEHLNALTKKEIKTTIAQLLDQADPIERWAILKLGTGGLRIGVSARFLKQALAQYGHKDIHDIEHLWHGLQLPYQPLFAWLENKAEKPNISDAIYFHPVMLAHPLDDKDLLKISPQVFSVERKFDGIRVQVVVTAIGKALYSRSGDDISHAFPDVLESINTHVVLDGELVIQKQNALGSFNDLQQRLNRKKPTKALMLATPAHVILYDLLFLDDQDARQQPFNVRRQQLEKWFATHQPPNMRLSELLHFEEQSELSLLRDNVLQEQNVAIEGLMLKRKDSLYVAGRPTGLWYKWKRDPYLIDAVLMYAQRGHGKRSSFYSDYTFGLWQDDVLLPIGKAYSGFTDEELNRLDKWIRHHTTARFGPVREVEKTLVLEVAFEGINYSSRHKSGIALRFPRINRIRWDKPALEADMISTVQKLIKN